MNKLLSSLCSHLDLKPEHTALLDERDTSDVWRQFAIWSLVGPDDGVIRFTKPDSIQYNAIQRVAQLYIEHCKDIKMWQEVKSAAKAAYAAAAAAWDVAKAADDAAAARAAYYAAWSVAEAAAAAKAAYAAASADDAAAAARAASYAATAAAWSAKAGYYAAYAYYDSNYVAAAADAHYERMANKLIELINAAPLKETI